MAKAACKCKKAECEECPEWIFTFADLVMLMMGFFVILWVLKPPAGKQGEEQQALPVEVLAAIREAFGHLPDPDSKDPVDVYMLMKKLEHLKPMKGPGDGGKTRRDPKGVEGENPEVEMVRPSKQVGTGAKVLFSPSDAALTPESTRSLDAIAALIKGHRNVFLVKGHASSDDFAEGADDAAKMALSLRRAQAAVDFLISRGVDRETIRVQGCATFEPIVQRAYTEDTRAQNRRVEVLATGTLVKELQGSGRKDFLKPEESAPATQPHPAGR